MPITHQPNPADIVRLIAAVLPQVAAVVVVDNGSSNDVKELLSDTGAIVVSLDESLGTGFFMLINKLSVPLVFRGGIP